MSFDIALNFRQTAAYVTDGAGQTYCLADHYPTTRGGATFGWEDTAGLDFRDRSNTADPRLGGINFSAVAGTRFRIDLPAAGAVDIHAAGGDGYGGGNPCNYDFKDGTTLLGGMSVVPTGVEFDDATNTARLRTDWPTLESPLSATFATTIFRLVSRDASTNCIAHLRVVQTASPPTAYTLTAAAGSVALTGSAAGLRAARVVPAAAGSVTPAGSGATLRASRRLPASSGSFAEAGSAAALRAARNLASTSGSYTLAGSAATLTVFGSKTIAAAAGQFTLAGPAAALRVTRRLSASGGSFALTGDPSGAQVARRIAAGTGTFNLTGSAASPRAHRALPTSSGSYTLAGSPATFGTGVSGKGLVCATVGLRPSISATAGLRPTINATASLRDC